jgi:hypothetical protein
MKSNFDYVLIHKADREAFHFCFFTDVIEIIGDGAGASVWDWC